MFVGVDLFFLNQKVKNAVDDVPLDLEYLRCLVLLNYALSNRLSYYSLLYHHILLMADVKTPANILLLFRQMQRTLLRPLNHHVLP